MKCFKVGDKVFGKVKGYPPWPARVTKVNGKRYSVVFYGTNETATIKVENLFYYLSNKEKYNNVVKRKYFQEALADIEEDIKKCGGSDGSDPNQQDHSDEEPASKKAVLKQSKRKRTGAASASANNLSTSAFAPIAKRLKLADQNHNDEDTSSENNDSQSSVKTERPVTPESTTSSQVSEILDFVTVKIENDELVEPEPDDNSIGTNSGHAVVSGANSHTVDEIVEDLEKSDGFENVDKVNVKLEMKQEEASIKAECDSMLESTDDECTKSYDKQLDLKDVNLLPFVYFSAITIYAGKIEGNSHYYKTIPPDAICLDDPSDKRLKVLPVRLSKDKYSGVIYTPPKINKFRCEYDRALKDAKIVEDLYELKAEIEVDAVELNDPRLIKNLGCDDSYVNKTTNLTLLAYKKEKLEWLEHEVQLFKTLVQIKKYLGMESANSEQALVYLEQLLKMPIFAISLKKRAFFVESIVRLRRYVGNTKHWNFSRADTKSFEANALKIREISDSIYKKIRELFDYGQEEDFLLKFDADCEEFRNVTKNMSQAEVFALCAEPCSRKAQLEIIFDEWGSTALEGLEIDNF